MAELRLAGCRTRPLGGYLKGLGVLRVVARQADHEARGRWRSGAFELSSRLDADSLHRFFLEEYAPSPVVSPWNGGSGFLRKDTRKDRLERIKGARSDRLRPYGEAIRVAREVLRRRGLDEPPSGDDKAALLRDLRRELPDSAIDWLDAAVVLTGQRVAFPPLLGSGGNDGRFDFSNNYAGAVAECVADESPNARTRSAQLLAAALDGVPAPLDPKLSLVHLQRDASPVNSPTGESDALGNPWDLMLAVEGALVMCAGAARRHGWGLEPRLVAPFAADSVAAGYGSAAPDEKAYSELWLPVWSEWVALGEVELLTREARAQVGRRRARTGLDFVRAAGELGVARGIDGFERYSILERAGQARLAVPAGRVEVVERPAVRALRLLDGWLGQLRRLAGEGERCPRGVRAAAARLDRAMFDFAARPDPARAAAVVGVLGETESMLARSARAATEAGLRPLARVAAAPWLEVLDDGSPEIAVAAALGSLTVGRPGCADLRDYLHGTRVDDRGRRIFDPDLKPAVPRTGDPVARLAAIHRRSHLDASRERDAMGLGFRYGRPADGASLRAFALGRLDDRRILGLASGLSLFDFRDARLTAKRRIDDMPCPAFDALAVAWHAEGLDQVGPRPGWAARLAADATAGVLREALLRLRLAGVAPLASATELAASAPPGPRLAAALLIRPSRSELDRMTRSLDASLPDTTSEKETP